jgi:hypothetical protein
MVWQNGVSMDLILFQIRSKAEIVDEDFREERLSKIREAVMSDGGYEVNDIIDVIPFLRIAMSSPRFHNERYGAKASSANGGFHLPPYFRILSQQFSDFHQLIYVLLIHALSRPHFNAIRRAVFV